MDLLNIDTRLESIEKALEMKKRVLTFEEGCKMTGFSKSYMYKLTCAGMVPFSKPNGKTIFFEREKLEEWLLSNKSKSSNEKLIEASTYVKTNRIK